MLVRMCGSSYNTHGFNTWGNCYDHPLETGADDNLNLGGSRWQVDFHQYLKCSALFQLEMPDQVFSLKLPILPSSPILFPDLTGFVSHLDHDYKIRYTVHPVLKQSVINMIH